MVETGLYFHFHFHSLFDKYFGSYFSTKPQDKRLFADSCRSILWKDTEPKIFPNSCAIGVWVVIPPDEQGASCMMLCSFLLVVPNKLATQFIFSLQHQSTMFSCTARGRLLKIIHLWTSIRLSFLISWLDVYVWNNWTGPRGGWISSFWLHC